MVRRLARLMLGLTAMIVLSVVFVMRFSPDYERPGQTMGVPEILPQFFFQESAQAEPEPELKPAEPTVNRMTHISRQEAPQNAQKVQEVDNAEEQAAKALPVAQRKTIRVGN